MIVLTIKNLATKKVLNEVYMSKDKAEERLHKLECDSAIASKKSKGLYLEAYSYDTTSEKALIEAFLPESRRVQLKGVNENG